MCVKHTFKRVSLGTMYMKYDSSEGGMEKESKLR